MSRWSPVLWACFVLQLLGLSIAQSGTPANQQNVTIPTTSSQIVYTPFLCDAATAATNPQCRGAWQTTVSVDGRPITFTTGPDVLDGDIIPQLFIRIRASALYLTTSFSNATTNITVSANNAVVTQQFNSSVGLVNILNLTEDEITMVVLTFVPGSIPTRLEITSLTVTVTGAPPTSSFLPSMTTPPSASLPTYFPASSTSTSVTSSSSSPTASRPPAVSNRTKIAEAVGLTVGLGLGLTAVFVLSFCYWRRRRRRSTDVQLTSPRSQMRNRHSFKDRWF
ncbi:hypothetical protein BD779DRAFT_1440319 [Infundibulicybe gibba]|nr:hypothetical protein BD779DRAFT_1440319 [Infundibulicybe gibba]